MNRRKFLASAAALPIAASMPSFLPQAFAHQEMAAGFVVTDSFAWGTSVDEMIAALTAKALHAP